MIVLDTNIASEFTRTPAPSVEKWRSSIGPSEVFLTAVTRAELRFGVASLPAGRRRDELEEAVAAYLQASAHRTLPFDNAAADLYGTIVADRRHAGRPISHEDAQIAAITRVHGATLATRNTRDFEGTGVQLINPFEQ